MNSSEVMEIVIHKEKIKSQVKKMAKRISQEHKASGNDLPPVMICVLNGAFMFFTDLVKNMDIDVQIDFIRAKSYDGQDNSGGVKILKDIDFPAGVVNIICGEPEIVATTLSKSTIPRLITMIGSTNTAKKVFADSSSSIKRLSMELGGNAPFIVFDDANIESAIDLAVGIKFGNSGQICVAANRFFIHEKIYDIFLNKYLERVKNLKLRSNLASNGNNFIGDLNAKVDLNLRKNITVIRNLDVDDNKVSAGQSIFSLKLSADYALSRNFSAILFYDHLFSKYEISTAFPQTNIRSGFTFRYSFGN